jgi:hypothetical protein
VNLAALLDRLVPTGLDDLAFPRSLLGAFRRKSITFCTGVTDERTEVYWFQAKGFTIDLRLTDGAATPVSQRQGWIGDTLWDDAARQLSWRIERSYQPSNQWPEPATLGFIGNCVLEYAPSGAYVEDWRQQASRGPLLGLRLVALRDELTGRQMSMEGGLVIAGDHAAAARSRLPEVDVALHGAASLDDALARGIATAEEIESYEVSVALGGQAITHSTQPRRYGEDIAAGDFSIRPDGTITKECVFDGNSCVLVYKVDVFEPDFEFAGQTDCSAEGRAWLDREQAHLDRHAVTRL